MSINSTKKPKKGRPAVESEAINLRLPKHVIEQLDEWRRDEPDIPNRQEAIRRTIKLGMMVKSLIEHIEATALSEPVVPPDQATKIKEFFQLIMKNASKSESQN